MHSIIIPGRANLTLAAAICAAFALSLTALPFIGSVWAMVLVTILLVPLNTPLWSLIHEAIHKNFHVSKRANEYAGRGLSVLFGACFGVLRFGHLMHHQYNRDWENEYYTGSRVKAWAHHYFQMLGGLYLTEVVMSLLIALFPLPVTKKVARKIFADERHYQAVLNSLLKPDNVRKIRIDFALIVAFYTGVFMLFGENWFVPLIALAGRGVVVSIMDNSYHYGTPRDNSVPAKELKTAPWMSRFILNFNYHLTHHKNVQLPWTELPAHHEAQGNKYAETLGSALMAQFKGPIKSD